MLPRSRLPLATWLLGFVTLVQDCPAAEWQWSVPDDEARAYLWVPPECRRLRGVVVANHNMIEQGILEHPLFRRTLSDLSIGEVWVVPTLEMSFDFHAGAGEHFQRVMDALAAESGYDELKIVPVVPMGHSACATYPWNFAAWNPQRTLCVLSIHGDAPQTHLTGYGRANVDWGGRTIDGVPGLMVMGEYEWWEDRLTPAIAFRQRHPKAPLALLADAGRGHFDSSDRLVAFLCMFIRKSAEQRLPTELPDQLDQPIPLRPVDPRSGWLIDRWHKDQPPAAPAAPHDSYAGDPAHAFWCFDGEMARDTEAYYAAARGKKPQLLGFVQDGQTFAGEPCSPRFIPMEDGISFTLSARFLETVEGNGANPERWAGLPKGTPLGHATGGGPVVISKIVGPVARLDTDRFAVQLDRSVYTANRRNHDMWLLASHDGNEQYKSAVQQAMIRALPNTQGQAQKIEFPPLADQSEAVRSIKLQARSDAGLPVGYYVREGPADVQGDLLSFTRIPPRSRFPIRVTVVAWQWGRSAEPKVQTAERVERSFHILRQQ